MYHELLVCFDCSLGQSCHLHPTEDGQRTGELESQVAEETGVIEVAEVVAVLVAVVVVVATVAVPSIGNVPEIQGEVLLEHVLDVPWKPLIRSGSATAFTGERGRERERESLATSSRERWRERSVLLERNLGPNREKGVAGGARWV